MIITNQTWCPLCEKEMTEQPIMYGNIRTKAIICRPCKIFTFRFDPAFNKWRDAERKIPCPHCESDSVKWFLRYIDQYIKFVCPKCGIIGEGDCKAIMETNGNLDLEIMDSSVQQGEETQLYIPVDKLKTSEANKQRIKAKLKKTRENK